MKLKQNSDREAAVQLIVGCVQNGYQDKMAELMGYGVPLDQKAKVVHSHRRDMCSRVDVRVCCANREDSLQCMPLQRRVEWRC